MVRVTAYDIPGGERKIDLGVFGSVQLTEAAGPHGQVAVLRDEDDHLVAYLALGKNWVVPGQGGGWDIVVGGVR